MWSYTTYPGSLPLCEASLLRCILRTMASSSGTGIQAQVSADTKAQFQLLKTRGAFKCEPVLRGV